MTSTEKNLKFVVFIGLIILLYIPFIVANGMFFPYITGKAYTFRIVTEIIFGIYLILATLYPIYRPKKNLILYTFGAFLISIFISNWTGINPLASFWSNFERMEGWVTIAHLFALFISLGSIFREKKDWIIVFNFSIIASLFMVFSAIGQVLESGFNTRVATTLGNSTYLGIYMLFNAFLSLFFLLRQKISFTGWYSWVYGIIFVLQSMIVFQTGTRGSMLGLLGGVVLVGILIALFNKENKIFRKTAFSLIGIVVVFISLIFLFKETSFIKENQALGRITMININEGTSQARINNWKMATEGFKERPVLGWGQSNFNYVFDKYYLPEHYGNETWFDRVHNILFDWLIAGGVVGLLLFVSIWLSALFNIWKSIKLEINEKAVLVGMLGGYFVHNFFVFDQVVSYIYFGLILAFIYSQSKDIDSKDSEFTFLSKGLSEKMKQTLVITIIMFVIPVSMYAINYSSYATNKDLISALTITRQNTDGTSAFAYDNGIYGNIEFYEKAIGRNNFGKFEATERVILSANQILSIQNLDQKVKQDYVNFAVGEMENLIIEYPKNSRYPYIFGSFFAQINQPELAEKYLLKAIELSQTKQSIRIPLIRLYSETGQGEKALQLAKETFELDESKKDLWKEYVKTSARFDSELSLELIKNKIGENNEWVEELLKENISNSPNSLQNVISLSAFYMQIDESEKAGKVLDQAIIDFPESESEINKLRNLQNI